MVSRAQGTQARAGSPPRGQFRQQVRIDEAGAFSEPVPHALAGKRPGVAQENGLDLRRQLLRQHKGKPCPFGLPVGRDRLDDHTANARSEGRKVVQDVIEQPPVALDGHCQAGQGREMLDQHAQAAQVGGTAVEGQALVGTEPDPGGVEPP